MLILNSENNIDSIVSFINENYEYQKLAFYVDNDENNICLVRSIQKQLKNTIIENVAITEDVAFCFVCGSYEFQQDSLIDIIYNNIKYGLIITNLSQSSYLSPHIQDDELIEIYMPEIVIFDKNLIKNQKFSSNLAVYSYIQSKRISIFEMEFYSRIFNANNILEFRKKLLSICDSFSGLMEMKTNNIQKTNIKVLELLIKYLKLQDKYSVLYNTDSIFKLSNSLSSELFSNFYENFYISSVFATNLYQKFFTLSFNNSYCFDYSKQLKYCENNFIEMVNEFKNSDITDNLNYKIYVNKDYFKQQNMLDFTKFLLQKYDFLCIFDDFGYNLVKKLEKCNIKNCILKVANSTGNTIFKQIRNYGLLDF